MNIAAMVERGVQGTLSTPSEGTTPQTTSTAAPDHGSDLDRIGLEHEEKEHDRQHGEGQRGREMRGRSANRSAKHRPFSVPSVRAVNRL